MKRKKKNKLTKAPSRREHTATYSGCITPTFLKPKGAAAEGLYVPFCVYSVGKIMCKRNRKEKLDRKDRICETEVVLAQKNTELMENQTLMRAHSHRKITLE